jgi:oligopeptide/dipeptide ABC transporter ATP-binding protein
MNELLTVRDLKVWFSVRSSFVSLWSPTTYIRAVDGVSFSLLKGEILGLIGESGSGKTTVARGILRLAEPAEGEVWFEGINLFALSGRQLREVRRRMQVVFQDPYESLSDRMKVQEIIAEPLRLHRIPGDHTDMVKEVLDLVKLSPPGRFLKRYPHELSGGQRQRVAAARAIVLSPSLLVADEPTSMIDVSLRVGFLNLLLDLREGRGLSTLFITHDVSLARYLCDRIATMYLGKIVEVASAEDLISAPLHPYTQALLSAVPSIRRRDNRREVPAKGEIPNPVNPPKGCRFHPRCPYAMPICVEREPPLVHLGGGHSVACFLHGGIS